MANSHWSEFHARWSRLGPPQRPNADVAAAYRAAVVGHTDRVLLMGVTPELADIGSTVIAVDQNPGMIANIWPGDTTHRHAELGNWFSLPHPKGHFTAAVCDGGFNIIPHPQGPKACFSQLERVLVPHGLFVLRLFIAPDEAETVEHVCDRAMKGTIASFHAFKWRFAHAMLGRDDPNIAVSDIYIRFNECFPDRRLLAAEANWPIETIDTIDSYKGAADIYNFPTLKQFAAALPPTMRITQTIVAGTYELTERCPLVVMERAA